MIRGETILREIIVRAFELAGLKPEMTSSVCEAMSPTVTRGRFCDVHEVEFGIDGEPHSLRVKTYPIEADMEDYFRIHRTAETLGTWDRVMIELRLAVWIRQKKNQGAFDVDFATTIQEKNK